MSDLTKKLAIFFESECSTLKDLDILIENNQKQQAWLDAVLLYRKGVMALQKDDLSGIESIKAANDALKMIVSKTQNEKADVAMSAMTESITKITKESLTESLANIKLSFSPLYVAMKECGFKEIMNESKFYEDGTTDDAEETMKEDVIEGDPQTTVQPEPTAKVEVPPAPIANAVEEPVAESKKESMYEKGFNEGRNYWKMGESHKNFLKTVVETTLFEAPYNKVKRYEEGFAAGYAFEEQLRRDHSPELFVEPKETSEVTK